MSQKSLKYLLAESNVAIRIADSHNRLETGALTGLCLLLNWRDLHHFVLQAW